MNNNLKIDTELVNQSGTKINSEGLNFREEIANLKRSIDAISEIWKDKSAIEFSKIAEEIIPKLYESANFIEETGASLQNTASNFDNIVNENKDSMRGI